MGYDIYLVGKDGNTVQVPRHNEGSIQQYSAEGIGTANADISVTYNYNKIYRKVLNKNLGDVLYGKQAKYTMPDLIALVRACGIETTDNYWDATPGNAGSVAALLLNWAILHPDAAWDIYG